MTRIRKPNPGEADALAALHVTTWQDAYAGLLPDPYLASLTPSERLPMWEHLMASPTLASIFVADTAGKAVGFSCGGMATDDDAGTTTGELWMIYVLRMYWGQGVGRDLHDALLAEFVDNGFETASLWVMESNARTRRWYERQGWTLDGSPRIVEVWEATVAEVRYRKPLTP